MHSLRWWCGAVPAALALAVSAMGQTAGVQGEEQAIRKTAAEYRAALAKGDARAMAQYWTNDAEYVDELGQSRPLSELLAEAAQTAGLGPGPDVKVTSSKIRFVAPGIAIEDGESETVTPDAAPARGRYHATWVKQNGRWRLADLCELPAAGDTRSPLEDLAWLIGEWTAESDGAEIEAHVRWNDAQTFLLRDVTATRDGKVLSRSSERVGVDPQTRKLRSWSFDSEGGLGETTWAKDGATWVGRARGVLSDGRESTATVLIAPEGQNAYTRRVIEARLEDQPLADQQIRFARRPQSGRANPAQKPDAGPGGR
jgi:uncharacterized protein (TIGR02246 family)